jgi:hypothetical protein
MYAQCVVDHFHGVPFFALLKLPDYRHPKELKFSAVSTIAKAVPCFICRFGWEI